MFNHKHGKCCHIRMIILKTALVFFYFLSQATFVRLVGGTTEYEGRLEIYKLGRWGTVCDNNFNHNLSVVVCRSLGLPW